MVAQGGLGLYLRDGQYQMNVSQVQVDGVGAWYERFEQLKAYCQQQGWFDEAKKRPLPAFPRTIGIVTSPDGAALRDIILSLIHIYISSIPHQFSSMIFSIPSKTVFFP